MAAEPDRVRALRQLRLTLLAASAVLFCLGCTSDSEAESSDDARTVDQSTIDAGVRRLASQAPPTQAASFDDLTISDDEYVAATEDAHQCFSDEAALLSEGTQVDVMVGEPNRSTSGLYDWGFRIGSADDDALAEIEPLIVEAYDECLLRHSSEIAQAYALQRTAVGQERSDELERLSTCVDEHGGDLPAGFDPAFDSLTEDVGQATIEALEHCAEHVPTVFVSPATP